MTCTLPCPMVNQEFLGGGPTFPAGGIFPFVFIWVSKVAHTCALTGPRATATVGLLLLWLVFSSLRVYPHSLSYFNEFVGGPERGHEHLHGSKAVVGVVMGMTGLTAVLFRPYAGALGDRHGRRPCGLAGAVLMAISAAMLFGPAALALVLVSRAIYGGGDALFSTSAMAWIVDGADPKRRARAMATIGMGMWLGLALGPQGAVLLRDAGGYDAVWGGAVAAAVAAWLLLAVVPAPERGEQPEASPRFAIPRGAVLPSLAILLACYGNGVFEAFGILHLTEHGIPNGAGIGGAASVFTVIAVTTFFGRFAGGALADITGPKPIAIAGAFTMAGAYWALAEASSFAMAAGGGVLVGVGIALLYPSLGLLVTRSVPEAERGVGLGLFLAALDFTFGVGPLIGGVVIGISSTTVALLSAGGLSLASLPLILLATRTRPGIATADSLPRPAANV